MTLRPLLHQSGRAPQRRVEVFVHEDATSWFPVRLRHGVEDEHGLVEVLRGGGSLAALR